MPSMAAFDKAILSRVWEAIRAYDLIRPGDKILVAVSGGKDSTALAWALSQIRGRQGLDFGLEAVHISSDFCSCCKKAKLSALLGSWGLAFNDVFVPIIGRLKPGRSMNCYWCSTQRRTELLRYAQSGGFNKIALGHHMDDILETFLMNMMLKGELSTMPARLDYARYPVSLIRPLALVEERQIIGFAQSAGFAKAACTCPYGTESKRREMRAKLKELCGGSSSVKRRIFDSFSSVKADYLRGIVERPAVEAEVEAGEGEGEPD
jgi:tRNA 2-thiocytidine biosynthesis protein TtcA